VLSDGPPDRLPRHLGRGVLTSVLLHAAFLFPFITIAFILGAREAALREDQVEMRFESVDPEELPDDLPPIDPHAPPQADPDKKKREALALRDPLPEAAPEPEIVAPRPEDLPKIPESKEQPPQQQEEQEKEQERPEEEPLPPEPPQKLNEKIVDLDLNQDVEPPPDAKYLAQKNNRAEEETRAERTNLEREQKGTESSSPSDRQDKTVGDAEDRVAELEDRKSKLGRRAPEVTPRVQEALPPSPVEKPKSLLSMREAPARRHDITPETVDPALPRDPQGVRAMPEENLRSMKDLPGRSGAAPRVSLRMTGKQYEYLFGDDAEAAERFAQQEQSKKRGRFSERQGRIQSALENFIPEVRPGNQTALNTRAAPFAAFIARMHRSIHKLWGFGFLEELEQKPVSSPYNNPSLITKLEIVLNADGTVHKVTVIRPSGFLPFDVAAIDTVYSAGPYAEPPRAIRSGNGKIYVHWTFHRDERQCGTAGVDYYILDNASAGGDKGEPGPTTGGPSSAAGLPAPTPQQSAQGPRRLERGLSPPHAHGHEHEPRPRSTRAGQRRTSEEEEAADGIEPDLEASRRAAQQRVRSDDPDARAVAEQWFDGYSRGNVGRMLRQAAFPFRSSRGIAARKASELETLLRDLIAEAPARRRVQTLQLYTAAGVRGALGGLPPGFDDGTSLLFAVSNVGGDTFVLVLSQTPEGWRATGLVRR
jgi:TonB family protein